MPISKIIDEIKREAAEENQVLVEAAKAQANEYLVQALDEMNAHYSLEREFLETEIRRQSSRLNARAELEIFRERQQFESKLVQELVGKAFDHVVERLMLDTKRYTEFLGKLLESAVATEAGREWQVALRAEDLDYFPSIQKKTKCKVTLLPPAKIRGGTIVQSGDILVDLSLDRLKERLWPKMVEIALQNLKR